MSKRLLSVLVCLFALVAASCGGGDDSATDDSRVDDVVDDSRVDDVVAFLDEDSANDDFQMSDSQTRCVAEALVAGLDSDLLDEVLAGTSNDDPPPGSEVVLIDALFGCAALQQFMIDSMVADGATQEEAECFAGALGEDMMRAMMTSELTGEDPDPAMEEELMSAVFEVMMTCGGFEE
jgi:hypothetical protein